MTRAEEGARRARQDGVTATKPRVWSLRHVGERPPTMNEHRTLHFRKRAEVDKYWRGLFHLLALEGKVGRCTRIEVVAMPLHKNHASPQDVAACAPAVKAAIDGLVDARVIPDDGPEFLSAVTFLPPVITDDDGLVLMIKETM